MRSSRWKCCSAEAVGTFGFTFVGAGAVCANQYSGGELGLIGIALAHAAALGAMVWATGPVSGGHLNPAVSAAAALDGRLGAQHAALYILAQLAGAATAGFLLLALYTPAVWEPVALGTPAPRPEVAFSTAVVIEAAISFLVVLTALQTGLRDDAPDIVYGLAIGSVVLAATLAAGSLTGAAMNPARAFGPGLASGMWRGQTIYWLGPLAGGVAAALAARQLKSGDRDGHGDRR